jgi:hypothetical protein
MPIEATGAMLHHGSVEIVSEDNGNVLQTNPQNAMNHVAEIRTQYITNNSYFQRVSTGKGHVSDIKGSSASGVFMPPVNETKFNKFVTKGNRRNIPKQTGDVTHDSLKKPQAQDEPRASLYKKGSWKMSYKQNTLSKWMAAILEEDSPTMKIIQDEVYKEAAIVVKINSKSLLNMYDFVHYTGQMRWYSPTLFAAYEYSFEDNCATTNYAKQQVNLLTALLDCLVTECSSEFRRTYKEKSLSTLVEIITRVFGPWKTLMTKAVYQPRVAALYAGSSMKTGLSAIDSNYSNQLKVKLKEAFDDNFEDNAKQNWLMWLKRDFPKVAGKMQDIQDIRDAKTSKRKIKGIIRPIRVNEVDIWKAVGDFQSRVYGNRAVANQQWDTFDLTLKKLGGREKQKEWIAAAACMLQLAVGSRSKGIYGVNQFAPAYVGKTPNDHLANHDDLTTEELEDGISGPTEDRDFDCSSDNLVTVKRLSKEKPREIREAISIQSQMKRDEKDGEDNVPDMDKFNEYKEAAKKAVDEEDMVRQITKPFQYYFFDPLSKSSQFMGDATNEEKLSRLSDDAQDRINESPRLCFFRLLEVFRKLVRAYGLKWSTTQNNWENIQWDVVGAGDYEYEHLAVSDEFVHSATFDRLKDDLRHTQGKIVSNAFSYLGTGIPKKTHELRRLYACYSYQFFGARTMKEMAYAQRVLGHRNLETSAFYTSLQIQLIPGTGVCGKTYKGGDYAVEFMETVKAQVDAYIKTIPRAANIAQDIDSQDDNDDLIVTEDDDDDIFELLDNVFKHGGVEKFKSAKGGEWHKMSKTQMRAKRIERSVDAIEQIRLNGYTPTRTMLKKLGESSADILNSDEVQYALSINKKKKQKK